MRLKINEDIQHCWFGYYIDVKGNKKYFYMTKDSTSKDPDEASEIMENSIPEPFTKFVFSGSVANTQAEKQGWKLVESSNSELEMRKQNYEKAKADFENYGEEDNNDVLSREEKMLIAKAELEKVCNINENIQVGDTVRVSTPGNKHYDGRTGIVDYIDDVITVLFNDGKSPKLNNFDKNQVHKIDESSTCHKLSENYWIDNKEVMDEVDRLGKELADDGWNSYADKYTGKAYYWIFVKRENDKAIAKAIIYNHNIEPEVIDITVDQAIGQSSLDSNDALRRKLGKMLLPQNESEADYIPVFGAKAKKDLNEFAYKIDDLKAFYNTSDSIDKNKFPNFFVWYDDMVKSGKLHTESMELNESGRYKGENKFGQNLSQEHLDELKNEPGKVFNFTKFDIFYGENKGHFPFKPCYYVTYRPSNYTSIFLDDEEILRYINANFKESCIKESYIEIDNAVDTIDELGYAGAVEIKDNRVFADETTLRQIIDKLDYTPDIMMTMDEYSKSHAPKNEAISKATNCVYFSQDGIDQIEFEGTEDECYNYISSIESEQDDEFGDEAPERFIKKINEEIYNQDNHTEIIKESIDTANIEAIANANDSKVVYYNTWNELLKERDALCKSHIRMLKGGSFVSVIYRQLSSDICWPFDERIADSLEKLFEKYPRYKGLDVCIAKELLDKNTENINESPELIPIEIVDLENVDEQFSDDTVKELKKYFKENDAAYILDELYYSKPRNVIEFDINNGDWKHEHLWVRRLIQEFFEKLDMDISIESFETQTDGSDCYSAHYTIYPGIKKSYTADIKPSIVSENVNDVDEVLIFKRNINLANNTDEIQQLIYELSDGVAEDICQTAFYENESNDLEILKAAVITAIDVYIEDNKWLGESKSNEESVIEEDYTPDMLDDLVNHYAGRTDFATIWDEITNKFNDEDLANDVIEALELQASDLWEKYLTESKELSTDHAIISVVDQVKAVYEAGLFDKLPVGRDRALTLDIFGPDKDRLAGYFKKQPEFNYEMNNENGIISHEFISDKYDIEVFDSFIQMYKIPQNESIAPDGYEPKKKGKAYKVFKVKNGKLYPPMVANPGGEDTPVGVWLTADEGEFAGLSKTGRPQVKSTGSGKLSYRPGWHLGDIPRASQFDRTNKETGEKEFPKDFVWAECEYTMDVDYQPESDEQGYMRTDKDGNQYRSDKYQHSLAGLPKMPKDGYYKYRTNPRPDTVPWVITGAIKVNKLLSDDEVNEILAKHGIEPIHRQGGDKTLAELGL